MKLLKITEKPFTLSSPKYKGKYKGRAYSLYEDYIWSMILGGATKIPPPKALRDEVAEIIYCTIIGQRLYDSGHENKELKKEILAYVKKEIK